MTSSALGRHVPSFEGGQRVDSKTTCYFYSRQAIKLFAGDGCNILLY